jgi:hypothetical protein
MSTSKSLPCRYGPFSTLVYRSKNLGDMIQTLALTRLLPQTSGVFRHLLQRADPNRTFVLNGFLHIDAPSADPGLRTLFAGVCGPHWRKAAYHRWMQRSEWPIGARDPATFAEIRKVGLNSRLCGCATMTFPEWSGPRSGVYSVDCDGPGTQLTHTISPRMSVREQWETATKLLRQYSTAEMVCTSRLHVALPCLAFGTPVTLRVPNHVLNSGRLSILHESCRIGRNNLLIGDVKSWANDYRVFLRDCLGVPDQEHAPICPDSQLDAPLTFGERLHFLVRDAKVSLGQRLGYGGLQSASRNTVAN